MYGNEYKIARGHEEPIACQFSIFLANRVGQLKDLLDLFYDRGVRVLGISVVDSADWAVIRTVVSDPDKTREALKQHSLPFTESQVLLVALNGDEALAEVCELLLRAELNVHFAYPLMIRRGDMPVMVFHVDDHVLARQHLIRHGLALLGDEDLADPI